MCGARQLRTERKVGRIVISAQFVSKLQVQNGHLDMGNNRSSTAAVNSTLLYGTDDRMLAPFEFPN